MTGSNLIRDAALNYARNDFTLAANLLSWLLFEEGYSIERLKDFISRRIHITESEAQNIIEFLCFH